MKPWHKDDAYLEYDDLVESGEIDPEEVSLEEHVLDRWTDMIDDAMDRIDMER